MNDNKENLEQEVDTKEFDTEEFAQRLIKMANEFVPHNYKENANKELDKLEESGLSAPHCAFIVDTYPDFNHIELKVTQPDVFVMKMCVNPDAIKENPQLAYGLAEMYKGFFDSGAREE